MSIFVATGLGKGATSAGTSPLASAQDVERRRREWSAALQRELQQTWLQLEQRSHQPSPRVPSMQVRPSQAIWLDPARATEDRGVSQAYLSTSERAHAAEASRESRESSFEPRKSEGSLVPEVGLPALAAAIIADSGAAQGVEEAEAVVACSAGPAAAQPVAIEPGARAWTPEGDRGAFPTPEQEQDSVEESSPPAASTPEPDGGRERIRCHVEWTANGIRLWLGVDADPMLAAHALATALLAELKVWASARGARVLGVYCNGQEVVGSDAAASEELLVHGSPTREAP